MGEQERARRKLIFLMIVGFFTYPVIFYRETYKSGKSWHLAAFAGIVALIAVPISFATQNGALSLALTAYLFPFGWQLVILAVRYLD